jgi:uncharacterized membrane protein
VPGFDKLYLGWLTFLNNAEPLVGIPMLAAGAALILSGWRLWRAVVVFNFILIGVGVGYLACKYNGSPFDWRIAVAAAVLLGLAGGVFTQLAAPLLGGTLGGLVVHLILGRLGLYGPTLWVLSAIALAAAIGWSYSYRQQIQTVLTSMEGGVLIASGLAVMLPEVPILYKFFSSMTATSPFMIGFYILVPTVAGVMLQQADLNRSLSKTARDC